jgi:signal transduction histidine kinase
MLAHELRNPLAPLRDLGGVASTPPGDPRSIRATEVIARQVGTLGRLVEDLLDVARINRGQVQLRSGTIELKPVLTRAIETTRDLIEGRKQRLSLVVPPVALLLEGDAMRLEQVFANLLNNAAKYTPEGGEIFVSADILAPEQPNGLSEVAVRVRDTGIGIASHMLPRVFDLFTQADRSLAHSQGRLGIGLSLVRSLVELHGGRVTPDQVALTLGA